MYKEDMEIGEIQGNRESLERLQKFYREKSVVPFIGAGFSKDFCPGWEEFLENFYENLKEGSMEAKDIAAFEELRKSADDNRFEAMAQLLNQYAEHLGFKQAMEKAFKKDVIVEKQKKFRLLNKVFSSLKITTNFDCLIEDKHDRHIDTIKGNRRDDLQKALNPEIDNTLVKIHGCVRDATTFILTKEQYDNHYGPGNSIDENRPLPNFLIGLFKIRHLLFIGCSLQTDRWLKLLDGRPNIPEHFAIIKQKEDKEEQIKFARGLSRHMITPIWIESYSQIEEILELLKPAEQQFQLPSHNITFVGREEHLERMENLIGAKGETGQVQVISGRLFNLEGAGGIGKTTLAIEAANRFHQHFPDGIFGPIRADEHSPQSFAVHLSRLLDNPQDEPPDNNFAQRTITNILKNKQALIILDNAVKWDDLQYMIPSLTKSTILLTTRDREMSDRLRIRYQKLAIETIALEIFTEPEAIALFKDMLDQKYSESDRNFYLEIAQSLGFLPIALRQAISLILFGPHYSPKELRDKLASDKRLDLLRKGQKLDPTSDNRPIEAIFDLSSDLLTDDLIKTLQYLATCAPGPIPLSFLKELSQNPDIQEQLEKLHTLSWCQSQNSSDRRSYQLHQLVRDLIRQRYKNPFAPRFLNLVHRIFTSDEEVHYSEKDALVSELEVALEIAAQNKDERLKDWVDKLFEYCYLRGYGDFFIRLCRTVIEIFPDDQDLYIKAAFQQEKILYRLSLLDEAMKILEEMESKYSELHPDTNLALCYYEQAKIQKTNSKYDRSLKLLNKAKKMYRELEEMEGFANCLGEQAQGIEKDGKPKEAIQIVKDGIEIVEKAGSKEGLAKCYLTLSSLLKNSKRLRQAVEMVENAESVYREIDNLSGIVSCYNEKADILCRWNKTDEALEYIEKGMQIYHKLGNKAGLAFSYNLKAQAFMRVEKFEKALKIIKKAELIEESTKNMAGLGYCYMRAGSIYTKLENPLQALEMYKKEEKILLRQKNAYALANCYRNQADILKNLQQLNNALNLYKKCEKIYIKLRMKKALINIQSCLFGIYRRQNNSEKTIEILKKKEDYRLETGNTTKLIESYDTQVAILKDLGKYDEALEKLNNLEKILKEKNKISALMECYQKKSFVYWAHGKLKEALNLQEKRESMIIKKNGNCMELVKCYNAQVKFLKELDRLDEAIVIQRKSVKVQRILYDTRGITYSLWNLGDIYRLLGEKKKQYSLWQQSYSLKKEIGILRDEEEQALENLKAELNDSESKLGQEKN